MKRVPRPVTSRAQPAGHCSSLVPFSFPWAASTRFRRPWCPYRIDACSSKQDASDSYAPRPRGRARRCIRVVGELCVGDRRQVLHGFTPNPLVAALPCRGLHRLLRVGTVLARELPAHGTDQVGFSAPAGSRKGVWRIPQFEPCAARTFSYFFLWPNTPLVRTTRIVYPAVVQDYARHSCRPDHRVHNHGSNHTGRRHLTDVAWLGRFTSLAFFTSPPRHLFAIFH
jgi:hypothetical protein